MKCQRARLLLALCVSGLLSSAALAGTSQLVPAGGAAGANSIGSSQIIDGSITAADLATGAVLPTHVLNRAPVNGADPAGGTCVGIGEVWKDTVSDFTYTCTTASPSASVWERDL